jgi:serine/threonine protein kinase
MKYVAGRSLETVLHEETTLPVETAIRILREASAALAHAHRHGVVHRDVKPANIMLDADDRVVLTDFGISKASNIATDATTEPRLTELGTAIGTPQYMAPEQAVGHTVDGRTDQYALAMVGFEMLAGYVPFDDETPHAIIHRQINEAPPDLAVVRPDVPRHVAAAIAKGLRKSPASRFATMEEFATALTDASMSLVTSPTGARPIAAGGGTRVLPADDKELDTALDRAFDAPTRSSSSGLQRFVWTMMAIAIVAGLGAVVRTRGLPTIPGLTDRLRGAARAASSSTVKLAGAPKPAANPKPSAPKTAAPAKDPARRTITLSVTSVPRATLFIDGKRVGDTPVTNRALTVGRTYRIRIEKKGYRTKSETITATGSRPLRRGYVLERVARR